ncbi:MAG: CinA family nicotinamide mononucleotide deamidase-related protein [Bacteroidota bacterium]
MKVHIITIGDEILIGQTIDTNSAWMGEQLNKYGASIQQITTISDDLEGIKNTLKSAFESTEIILMTGGLGPTKDDVTKKAIAEFYDTGFVFSQATYDRIIKMFAKWGRTTTEAHRQQCFMPQNATLLFNKMGTAPGMWMEENGKVLVSMPGVPYEMKYLMEYEVIPRLLEKFQKDPIVHRTVMTVGEGESRIAARIADFEATLPPHIKLAYLPGTGKVRLRLTGTGANEVALKQEVDAKVATLVPQIEELVYAYDDTPLEAALGQLLLEQNKRLATAESCTGGYLAHKITSIAGSSAYYIGSTIAYANAIKMQQLGVSKATLEQHGAVSAACVEEMLVGLLERFPADVGIAISGIAGPGGGTPDKPVGTIWLAVGSKDQVFTRKLQLGKDRIRNIQFTTTRALDFIRQFLLGRLV